MRKIENKAVAVLIYLAPYIAAALLVGLYALLLYFLRPVFAKGLLVTQTGWESLLTYLPMAIGLFVAARCVKKAILKKIDLSVIGVESLGKSKPSFIPVAIVAVLIAVALGFGMKTVAVDGNKIVETGFWGVGSQTSTVSEKTKWQEKDGVYTVYLSNGKQYDIQKDSDAGKQIEKVLYGD